MVVKSWDCPFCHCKNEDEAQNCVQCGAHAPVDMPIADVRKIVQKPRPKIAGLRGSAFFGAAIFFCLAAVQYDRIQAMRAVVRAYHAACGSHDPACVEVPAQFDTLAPAQGTQGVVEITPVGQTAFPVSADLSNLPQSGQGTAIFWHGQLTALATPVGVSETNFSPVAGVAPARNLMLFWILLGINATLFPFIFGWAFKFDYEIADDKTGRPVSGPPKS